MGLTEDYNQFGQDHIDSLLLMVNVMGPAAAHFVLQEYERCETPLPKIVIDILKQKAEAYEDGKKKPKIKPKYTNEDKRAKRAQKGAREANGLTEEDLDF